MYIQDFIKDNYPEMAADEKRTLAESMDMRWVSRAQTHTYTCKGACT